ASSVDLIGALDKGVAVFVEGGVEHRAHKQAERGALELIGDEKFDDRARLARWPRRFVPEGPAIIEFLEGTVDIFDEYFELVRVAGDAAGIAFADRAKAHLHFGDDDLDPLAHRRAAAHAHPLAQRHESWIGFDVGNEREHFGGGVADLAAVAKALHGKSHRAIFCAALEAAV